MSEPVASAPTCRSKISSDRLNLSDECWPICASWTDTNAALLRGKGAWQLLLRGGCRVSINEPVLSHRKVKHGSNRSFGVTFALVFGVMSLWPMLVGRT
jgi:hypothetical protein